MVAPPNAVQLICGSEQLSDSNWWHALAERAGSDSLSRVTAAQPREGDIVQSNCVIRKFTLQLDKSEQLFVVLKQVNLAENRCAPGLPQLRLVVEHMQRWRR